jgi:spermidine synthase
MGFMPRPATGPRWDAQSSVATPPAGTRNRFLASLPLYGAALFLGAGLLFLVQPMFAKMVLPLLGGAPAVWNTAMVFFQACLLGGYVYAHVLTRNVPPAWQAAVHLALLAAAFATLPIAVAASWSPPAESAPVPWLIGLMAVSIGLPFFTVSATAPLLQRWFAQSGHAAAKDPYFLYGASNLGSMTALLAYPLLVEPTLTLANQAWAWTAGYGALAALIAACAFGLRRSAAASAPAAAAPPAPLAWRTRLHWLALAIVPSSLMLGVTTHISTDVAAIPLLWVAPLALYLLTFVIAFARKPLLGPNSAVLAHTFAITCLVLTFWLSKKLPTDLSLHLLAFFVTALMCHCELARRRPEVGHLTEFYLWLSLGGVLGGAFNALLAPLLFTGAYEYVLVLIFACLLRPPQDMAPDKHARLIDVVLPLVLLAVLIPLNMMHGAYGLHAGVVAASVYAVYSALALFSFRNRPLRFTLGVAAVLVAPLSAPDGARVIFHERSFFGIAHVTVSADGKWHFLRHGTTVHGAQAVAPDLQREPQTYYSRHSPIGQVFAAMEERADARDVAVIGLGTGTLACYRRPGQDWTFYEIDPIIDRLARDSRYFNYLSECAPEARTVLGDARISLARAANGVYDVFVLDAFSSDAVPMHLLTREALSLYLAKLAPDGILAFHISNRYLKLEPVVARLAADAGLSSLAQFHIPPFVVGMEVGSLWVVMTRTPEALEPFRQDERWRALAEQPGMSLWTDDFSNIISVLKY